MMQADQSQNEGRCCSTCGQQTLQFRKIEDEFDYGPDDERIKIIAHAVPVLICQNPDCGETLFGPEAARVRHEAICLALGLLTPNQIKTIRERLAHSQADFARLTGFGVATLSRWERGRLLQTQAFDRYLRILDALPEAVRVLEQLGNHQHTLTERFPGRVFSSKDLAQARQFRLKAALNPIDESADRESAGETPADRIGLYQK